MSTTQTTLNQPSADATDAAITAAMSTPVSVGLSTDLDLTKLTLTQNFSQLAGVKKVVTTVPTRKPNKQLWLRVRSGAEWQVQVLTLTMQDTGDVYFVHPDLYGELADDVRPMMLYLYITRDGTLCLWPVSLPSEDGRLNPWAQSAHTAAKAAQLGWVKVVSSQSLGAYEIRVPTARMDEPTWPELSMREILNLAFRDKLITSLDHPIVRGLRGEI
ncbi:MAG: hypothetical protein ACK5NX_02585 [Armatimonadota bacterium]